MAREIVVRVSAGDATVDAWKPCVLEWLQWRGSVVQSVGWTQQVDAWALVLIPTALKPCVLEWQQWRETRSVVQSVGERIWTQQVLHRDAWALVWFLSFTPDDSLHLVASGRKMARIQDGKDSDYLPHPLRRGNRVESNCGWRRAGFEKSFPLAKES